jgi:3-hydroxybutyryl-CoA dehydratase
MKASKEIRIRPGLVLEYSRIFSREDIQRFAEMSGDFGAHHVLAEPRMAHGLLVVSIVTKLGGDINYVSQSMQMKFLAPVYEGEEVRGRIVLDQVLERPSRFKIRMRCECFKADGTMAVSGASRGQVWKSE